MIDIGMLTAPRKIPTLQRSLTSLRASGFRQRVHLFAEPGGMELENKEHVFLHQNMTQLGCFKNFNQALTFLLRDTVQPYLLILSDDILYPRNLQSYLQRSLKEAPADFGYYALLSLNHDVFLLPEVKEGWNQTFLGWESWGGLFLMKRESAQRLWEHPFYQDHLNHYQKNEQIDACVSECFKLMDLPMYLHVPSLTEHIGETSTLEHNYTTYNHCVYQFNPVLPAPPYFPIGGN